ncbi:uncharacterized protein LOC121053990 [Oryza brachyantha]|uniref:uncharacterized protein LOC121053990 n=1 Tax=Oryza brachyantha TaxID=4533 RepID=UPI001ADA9E68|nr:uncharacterized protein LOC121053990 [Oryza brachyantha]
MGILASAVATTTVIGLLLLLGCPPPYAAARPLPRGAGATRSAEEAALLLAPPPASDGGGLQWRAAADAAARAGKWLPFAGAAARARYPALWGFPPAAGRPLPWAAAARTPPELVFRTGGQLMEEPPHEEDAATRQEQVAMWASLLNPAQVRPTAPAWAMVGNGEAPPADAEPTTAEGMDAADEPPATGGTIFGQPKWPGSP